MPKKGQDCFKKIANQNKTYFDYISRQGKLLNKEFVGKPEYETPLFEDFKFDTEVLN